jgi:cytochrome P450
VQTVPSFKDPAVLADLDSAFDALRAIAPVYRSEELGMVVVTGYEQVLEVLRDPDRFRNKGSLKTAGGKPQPAVAEVLAEVFPYVDTLIATDGPRHAHHAGLIKSFLTKKRVRDYADRFVALTGEILDKIETGVEVEFVERFSLPLTIGVLCIFTGVPIEHAALVKRSSDAEVNLLGAIQSVEENLANARAIVEMQRLLTDLIAARRDEPADDLISHIVHAPAPDGLAELTLAEQVMILRGVVLGGNETTRGLINAMVLKLASEPDLAARLAGDEQAFSNFIDEGLRHTSPVIMLFRRAARDTELAGVPIARGDMVGVSYGAANHDAARFSCPHAWDLDRPGVTRHLAFGFGTHYCVGSPIARLEAEVALRGILDRYARIELAPGAVPEFYPSFMVRQMNSLKVVCHPR